MFITYWMRFLWLDIQNNQGGGTYWDVDYLGYHRNWICYCFIVHCFEENNIKHTVTLAQYDVALRNHNLCTQPTDYSLLCNIDRLADNWLICRLSGFPKSTVGSLPMWRQIVSTMFNTCNIQYFVALQHSVGLWVTSENGFKVSMA